MLKKGDEVKFNKDRCENHNITKIDFNLVYRCTTDEFDFKGQGLVYLEGQRSVTSVYFLDRV